MQVTISNSTSINDMATTENKEISKETDNSVDLREKYPDKKFGRMTKKYTVR